VLILHGTHPGCPEDEWASTAGRATRRWSAPTIAASAIWSANWPAQGYVALAININAENTFGFGEPMPGERLDQLVTLHLDALAEAAAGGANDFGVELAGRADVSRLAIFGHSRGGEAAVGWRGRGRLRRARPQLRPRGRAAADCARRHLRRPGRRRPDRRWRSSTPPATAT
jgi:hypothetical protein